MTFAQHKQQLLAILLVLAIVLVLLLSFTAFEVIQHMNGLWHALPGIADGPNIISGHP